MQSNKGDESGGAKNHVRLSKNKTTHMKIENLRATCPVCQQSLICDIICHPTENGDNFTVFIAGNSGLPAHKSGDKKCIGDNTLLLQITITNDNTYILRWLKIYENFINLEGLKTSHHYHSLPIALSCPYCMDIEKFYMEFVPYNQILLKSKHQGLPTHGNFRCQGTTQILLLKPVPGTSIVLVYWMGKDGIAKNTYEIK